MSSWYLRNKNIFNICTSDTGLGASYYRNYFICKEPSYTFPVVTHEFNLLWVNSYFSLDVGFLSMQLGGLRPDIDIFLMMLSEWPFIPSIRDKAAMGLLGWSGHTVMCLLPGSLSGIYWAHKIPPTCISAPGLRKSLPGLPHFPTGVLKRLEVKQTVPSAVWTSSLLAATPAEAGSSFDPCLSSTHRCSGPKCLLGDEGW